MALAMDARSFAALPTRTYRERVTVNRADWLFLAAVALVVAAVVLALWFAGITRFTIS